MNAIVIIAAQKTSLKEQAVLQAGTSRTPLDAKV